MKPDRRPATNRVPWRFFLFRHFAVVVSALVLLVNLAPLGAQSSAGHGTIMGRVSNPATGEYMRDAEIRLEGTNRVTHSEEGGHFRIDHVPAGEAMLVVTFSGYHPATEKVNITAGGTAVRSIELVSVLARPGSQGETLKLGEFIVSSDREGNAKAIMAQRRNMNISTSVASDIYGDVAEGDVGEFLKYLPGVDVEYVDGISRGPRLGGLDGQYVGVTMDGSTLASADGFTMYGSTLNGGGSGEQSRAFGFESISISAIESIEINRTLSPDMDASSPAGTINLKTKRAFDQKGRRIAWQTSLSANTKTFDFGRTIGPDDNKRHPVRPNFKLDYSDVFLNQRLGIRLGVTNSLTRPHQQSIRQTYNHAPTSADPRPMVITALTFVETPSKTDKFNSTLTADFKATERLVLSMTAMYNSNNLSFYGRTLTFTAAASNANVNTGRSTVIGDLTDIQTNGQATNTSRSVAYSGDSVVKLTRMMTLTPKFEYKIGTVTVDGTYHYSRAKNDYEAMARGTVFNTLVNNLRVDFRATRPDPLSHKWTVTQLSGPDWSDLANFTNPRIREDDRDVFTEITQGEINAKYVAPWRVSTFFKIGGKIVQDNRVSSNRRGFWNWNYIGPGGGPTGSFAAFPSLRPFDTEVRGERAISIANLPVMINREAVADAFRRNPEHFEQTFTVDQYYTAYIGSERDFTETITAGYGMANARIGKVQLQGGLRWEGTETKSKEWDPLLAADVVAAGFPINASTRRATTLPGLEYQYFSRPRTTRVGDYDNLFPSLSAKYSIRPNLQAQFGYNYAIRRPPIGALSGVWAINDVSMVVTAPNPDLKPEETDNYTARLAYYFEPVGSFTLLVLQKEITNQRITTRVSADQFGYGSDPSFADFEFQTQSNRVGEVYRYRSFELGYNQQLSFLPGALQGTVVNLGYTRSYANRYFPGVTPHIVTGNVAWNHGRYSLRLGTVWQDDTPFTSVFGRYRRHNIKFDLSGGFKLTKSTTLFFQGINITREPQLLYEGNPVRGTPAALYAYGYYGSNWVVGIKGSF